MSTSTRTRTGISSDIIRLANLYGLPGEQLVRMEIGRNGVVFEWRNKPGEGPRAASAVFALDDNPPDPTDTPIFNELKRDWWA